MYFVSEIKIIELGRTTRNPRLLLRLLGRLLRVSQSVLRLATLQLLSLLYQEPPRLTRLEPDVAYPHYSLSLLYFMN